MNEPANNSTPSVPALRDSSHLPVTAADADDVTKWNGMERFHTRFADYLCDRQLRAIELIFAGEREGKIAEQVGVGRKTLWRWRNDCHFRWALAEGRELIYGAALDRLRVLVPHAVDRLQDQLEAGDAMAPYRFLRLVRIERSQPPDESERSGYRGAMD